MHGSDIGRPYKGHILTGRSGKNTRIQNSTELVVSLTTVFSHQCPPPEFEVAGNAEVSAVRQMGRDGRSTVVLSGNLLNFIEGGGNHPFIFYSLQPLRSHSPDNSVSVMAAVIPVVMATCWSQNVKPTTYKNFRRKQVEIS